MHLTNLAPKMVFFGLASAFFTWLFLIVKWNFEGLPYWSDEFFYWQNAYSFYVSGQLDAVFTLDGNGSRLLGADAHGPTYTVLHGLIANLFGWNTTNFQLLNFALMVFLLFVLFQSKELNSFQKFSYAALVYTYPFFKLYAFGFLQEVIHGFIAFLIAYFLLKMNRNPNQKKWTFALIGMILIGGIFRPLWFLWGLALAPFCWKHKSWFLLLVNICIWPVLAGLFSFYFMESLPNKFGLIIQYVLYDKNYNAAFQILVNNCVDNLRVFFFDFGSLRYALMRPLFFLLLCYFTWKQAKSPSTLFLSLVIIGWINFLLLIFLYDAYYWRDIRTMSPLFYFLGFFFIIYASKALITIFQIFTLISMFTMIPVAMDEINVHRGVEPQIITQLSDKLTYLFEKEKITSNSKIYVDESFYMNNNLIALPLIIIDDKPIKYIIPYYEKDKLSYDYILFMIDGEIKFKRL